MKKFLLILFNMLCLAGLQAQDGISNYEEMSSRLKKIQSAHPDMAHLESIARTASGQDIWVLTLGKGDIDNHPGIAVVSGVDGSLVAGPEIVVRFAEQLMSSSDADSIGHLLDSVVFYLIPNVSPEASEQYFADLKYERMANSRPTDDDRDGRLNEDPFEDLDANGAITMLRIEDPSGDWKVDDRDPRVMVKADQQKGEKGSYLLITEGVDNDGDKQFNEDGAGGIAFIRNMTFKFEHFKPGAGPIPVSEPESRGLLDFLYERWNIYAVLTIGPADNLSKPMSYDKGAASAEIVTGIQENDALVNAFVSDTYNEITGKKHHAAVKTFPGGFMQWAYFHYGRFSFGTPAFFVPEVKAKKDTIKTKADRKEEYHEEVNFLRWADSVLTDAYFAPWTEIDHPGFEGRKVEAGGILPFAMKTPPVSMIDSLVETHGRFLLWLASNRPEIEVLNLRVTDVGNQLFRVEMDIYNRGLIPAMSEIGERTRWLKKPKIELEIQDSQQILSGRKITLLDELRGDAGQSLQWLIRGKGSMKAVIGAPQTGIRTLSIDLK